MSAALPLSPSGVEALSKTLAIAVRNLEKKKGSHIPDVASEAETDLDDILQIQSDLLAIKIRQRRATATS